MKNLYKISKGQLITLWIFGFIGWMFTLGQDHGFALFFFIFVPAVLVFYTLGWRNYHKSVVVRADHVGELKRKITFKKIGLPLVLILLIIGVVSAVGVKYEEAKKEKEKRESYVGSMSRMKKHIENAEACVDNGVSRLKDVRLGECKQRYDKAYASYLDCKKDMPWQDHYDCVNWPGSNYEAIDCSQETIVEKIETDVWGLCYADVEREDSKIDIYEQGVVMEFLNSQPKSKASFTLVELQELYNLFPQEVFNDATKQRLIKYIEREGYEVEN